MSWFGRAGLDTLGASGDPRSALGRVSLLRDLAAMLGREVDLDALLRSATERVAEALGAERASLWLIDADAGDLVTKVAILPEVPALRLPIGRGLAGFVAEHGEVLVVADALEDPRFDPGADRATGYSTRAVAVAPIRDAADGPVRGVLQVLDRAPGKFGPVDGEYLGALGLELGRALALTTLRADRLSAPGLVLRGPFNHIVGRSSAMLVVYERLQLAAETDATVLLRGPTGTGKSLLARAIAVNSARGRGPFVVVDGTTLPAELVESELFGHERGAFTGADRRVIGRVEAARGGTLFIDEIGELPMPLQGKLLRLLQERAFERVGGRETLDADIRVVAATHRDLERLVRDGVFREDLYYRIKVVELRVPSLAERGAAEIEALARHFAELYARRYGRPAPRLDAATVRALVAHPWPGNVRELEHWVESAVVLSRDGVLRGPEPAGVAVDRGDQADVRLPLDATLDEASHAFARAVLVACGGNRTEAAKRLGIGRNTLARLLQRRRAGGPG